MRCFIAIDLDDPVRNRLARLVATALPPTRDLRPCSEAQLHITLRFLGEVGEAQLPAIHDAMAAAARQIGPFLLRFSGLGGFPDARGPRVLWFGVTDPQRGCQRWLEAADPLFAAAGFAPEGRTFTPHVTLARSQSRVGGGLLARVIRETPAPELPDMTVGAIVLYESLLGPGGARYVRLEKARLLGP